MPFIPPPPFWVPSSARHLVRRSGLLSCFRSQWLVSPIPSRGGFPSRVNDGYNLSMSIHRDRLHDLSRWTRGVFGVALRHLGPFRDPFGSTPSPLPSLLWFIWNTFEGQRIVLHHFPEQAVSLSFSSLRILHHIDLCPMNVTPD